MVPPRGHLFRRAEKVKTVTPAVEESTQAGVDPEKRNFLRIAGLAGLGIIASQVFPKKAEAYVLGGGSASAVGVKNSSNTRIDPALEGGNLATIAGKDFATQTTLATVAKESGGNLATIATNTNALTSLTFSAGALVTTGGGGGTASTVGVKDTTSTQINPATEDSVIYLRRIAKVMESLNVVDTANRQRISLDTIPAGVTLPTVTTVGAVTAITNALPTGANVIGSLTNLATVAGQNQQMYQDVARNAYANGVRQNLVFS